MPIILLFLDRYELAQWYHIAWLRRIILISVVNDDALVEVEDKEALDKLGEGEDLLLLLLFECRLQMALNLPHQKTSWSRNMSPLRQLTFCKYGDSSILLC